MQEVTNGNSFSTGYLSRSDEQVDGDLEYMTVYIDNLLSLQNEDESSEFHVSQLAKPFFMQAKTEMLDTHAQEQEANPNQGAKSEAMLRCSQP